MTSPPWQGAVHACDVGDGTAGAHSCQDLGGDETVLEPQTPYGKHVVIWINMDQSGLISMTLD